MFSVNLNLEFKTLGKYSGIHPFFIWQQEFGSSHRRCFPKSRSFKTAIYGTFVRRMRKNARYCFDKNHDERACCRNWNSLFHLLFDVVVRNWAGPLFLPWVCGTCNKPKHFGWRGKFYVNKHSNDYTMHEDGNNFHKLWMITAGNLSLEIRYQKLKVNSNWQFPESSLQFFGIISWVVLYSSFIVRLVCFSSQNFLTFECFWKIRFLL